jgi:hypothetical protein
MGDKKFDLAIRVALRHRFHDDGAEPAPLRLRHGRPLALAAVDEDGHYCFAAALCQATRRRAIRIGSRLRGGATLLPKTLATFAALLDSQTPPARITAIGQLSLVSVTCPYFSLASAASERLRNHHLTAHDFRFAMSRALKHILARADSTIVSLRCRRVD